jgi:CDP-diacylglycerol--glycerol-3-phosphate 3-phosphatidyltransferase
MLPDMAVIGDSVGGFFSAWRDTWGRGLARLGVTPNGLTLLGAVLMVASGVLLCLAAKTGAWWWSAAAAFAMFWSLGCDMLDGAVARFSGRGSPFGAVLDSTVDRISDFAIWAGLAIGYAWREPANLTFTLLAMLAFLWGLLISYVKARAEDFIDDGGVGYWQRGERGAGTLIAITFCNPFSLTVMMATLPFFTAMRRLLHARAKLAGREPIRDARKTKTWRYKIQPWLYPRATWPYDLMTLTYIAFLIFARFNPDDYDILGRWLR